MKDSNNENLEIENVLCHLNIYSNPTSYYTYTFIPTNAFGKVILTKDDILANTELKHCFDDKLGLDKTEVKFEFFILGKEFLNLIIKDMENYLKIKPEEIKEDLRRRGFGEQQIENEIPRALKMQSEDKILYDFLLTNRNVELDYDQENSKITGYWDAIKDFEYEIILKA